MLVKKYPTTLILVLAFLLASCQTAEQNNSFTADDKTEVVRLSLERALVDQEIPDYQLLVQESDEIVLSSENISDIEVPEIPGYQLLLLTPEEIQAKANAEGDFLYLQFNPFEVNSPDEVGVGLGSQWAVADASTVGYLSGGGLQMLYTREDAGWIGEVEAIWMS